MGLTKKGPSKQELTITVAGRQHTRAVADLHILYVSSDPVCEISQSAADLIRAYYDELQGRDDCSILVALVDGEVVGYAALVARHRRILWRSLARKPLVLLRIIMQVRFWRPMTWYVARLVSSEFLGGKWPEGDAAKPLRRAWELRSIAVKPQWRGRSIAPKLLQSALQHAMIRQWAPVVAWVAQGNLASNRAFTKVGFQVVDRKTDQHGSANVYLWTPEITQDRGRS